jgi:hypothetical protein
MIMDKLALGVGDCALDGMELDTSKNCAPERVWGRSGCVAASGGAFVCSGATVSG